MASTYRMPAAEYVCRSKSPIVAVARYDAIGSTACQVQVLQPPAVRRPRGRPLATASNPSGTVIRNVYEALSLGWSLTGNHVAATAGSPATRAQSSVWMNPEMPSWSTIVSGTPS